MNIISGPASVAEVPYKECFICKPDVTTVVQTKTHGNEFFYYKLQLVTSQKVKRLLPLRLR